MPEPVVKGMPLTDFLKRRTYYERRAVARKAERLNTGMHDSTWDDQVRDEIEIDLLERVDALTARVQALSEAMGLDEKV